MVSEGLAHTTVLLNEAVEALAIKADGIYVDGTFGRGGHSALILERLGSSGRLIALDKDPAAVAAGRTWRDARFQMVHRGLSKLAEVLRELGVAKVDGILVLLAVFGGLWLDKMLGTRPLFTVGLVLASAPVSLALTFWVARRAINESNTASRNTSNPSSLTEGEKTGE